ncbi:hypothetical protein TomMM35A_18320 [Sphingobium sp. TomMM35A]
MNADLLARLIAAGTPAELVAEVAMLAAQAQADRAAIESRRSNDRQRSSRRHAKSRDDTCDHVTARDVTDSAPFPAPAPSFPPDPQTNPTPTHTPEGDIPRTRKADPFPMPEGAAPEHWRDLLANRKRKNLPNTPTAHKRLMADIARFSDEEWPPGRLIEHAAAMGWAAIYDPRQDSRHDRTNRNRQPHRDEPANPLVRAGIAFEAGHTPGSASDLQ